MGKVFRCMFMRQTLADIVRVVAQSAQVHAVCTPHTLAAIRTCPGQGKPWYSSCRASIDIHEQDLKGEMLWTRKRCIDLVQV